VMFDQVKVGGAEACPEPVEGKTFMVLVLVGWCPHGDVQCDGVQDSFSIL